MTADDFIASLAQLQPPQMLTAVERGLWHAGKEQWDQAHELAQSEAGPMAAWLHAYLHRWEGDDANAGYWYRRAGRPPCRKPLAEEWADLVAALFPRHAAGG